MAHDLARTTIADFGEQWLRYRDNPGYYGSVELLADLFGPLLAINHIVGLRTADIGSGTGRIVKMLLDAGAAHVYAVEPSAAMMVLRENIAVYADRVTCLQDVGEHLPSGLDLDLVVSIGVLHHIPDPTPVVRAAYDALRPGGRFLVWLYGREGNEAYLRLVQPLRRITTYLPHFALVGVTHVCGFVLDAYIALCRFVPLPMRNYMREVLAKFPGATRRLTIYDQLNPAFAKYYAQQEAQALLAAGQFRDIQTYHRHGYSWTVIGTKPE